MQFKTCSVPSVFMKMQIITVLTFYHIPIRVAFMKKSNDNKCWVEGKKRRNLICCW